MATRTDEQQMISERIAPVLVARTLGPFDLVVIFVAIVLFINNSSGVQFAGPSMFIFWPIAFLTFLITGAFVTAQLGRMFPEEGSLYVWTHKALGPFWGFFAGFVAWWPGPIVMVAAGVLVANFLQQFAILALLGIETPLNMGVEVKGGEKAIRTYLIWGCIIVMAAYLWTTWGNMVSVPLNQLNGTTGGAEAVGASMGKGLGAIVALILAWVFLTATVVYNYAFARLLFVSGLEKRLPHQVGKVNQNKVPANAVILQTVIATIVTLIVFFLLGFGQSDPYKYFYALYAGLTIVWCISTALLFLDIFFAERASPNRFEEARRVPRWVLNASGAVGTVANIVAVFFIFTGS